MIWICSTLMTRLNQKNGEPLHVRRQWLERTKTGNLFATPWKFAKHDASGIDVSRAAAESRGACR